MKWELIERALKNRQAQSNLSRAIQEPDRPVEGERRMSSDGVVHMRPRAVIEADGDESDLETSNLYTSPDVHTNELMRSRKRVHDLNQSTHIPANELLEDPDPAIQAGSSTGNSFMSLPNFGPRKRRRNHEFDTGNYRAQNSSKRPPSEPSIDVKQLLNTFGDLLERSAQNWLAHPEEFFKLDDIISTLDKVVDRAFDKALCIFEVAGSSENHSKMIQVVTAYTFQQEYGHKHMGEPRLKRLRQRGNKFSTLVEIFGCKSILLLMPCTRYVRMAIHRSDLLTPDSVVSSG